MDYFRPSIRFTVWCLDKAEILPLKLILISEIEIYHFAKKTRRTQNHNYMELFKMGFL